MASLTAPWAAAFFTTQSLAAVFMHQSDPNILVSDFDGTLTQVDFFQAVLSEIVQDDLAIWNDYVAGRITHFEALAGYYRQIDWEEDRLLALVHNLGFPEDFLGWVERLGEGGFGVVIASAGCEWYIHKLVEKSGARDKVTVHANHGTFVEGQGLVMELPRRSPFFEPNIGISKEGVVAHWQSQGKNVAFSGDGPTDLKAALLVDPSMRFARGTLATTLRQMGQSFIPFSDWTEVPKHLLQSTSK